MTPGRLITADARTVSGREFFDAVFGSSPEKRAARTEQARRFAAERDANTRRDILAMRDRIAALLSPEAAAKARAEWARQDTILELEAEHVGDGRWQVAA